MHAQPDRPHIVVDMTPLEPRGQNGGAGLVATSLIHHLSALQPDYKFTLLTADDSHVELAPLESDSVRRRCVVARRHPRTAIRRLVEAALPVQARVRLRHAYRSLRTSARYSRLSEELQADLLFCPFTVPYFWRPGVPCVSVVYDLQHETYPRFFSDEQLLNRRRHVADACSHAERLVCISEYVRRTLVASQDVCPERVVTIRLGLLQQFPNPDNAVLDTLRLNDDTPFLLFPANFWPHKNHTRLFEALRTRPGSKLKLVCTGAPNAYMRSLEAVAMASLPPGTVVFGGYVSPAQLAALLQACAGLIFPSLYEGFGMPILEAMAHGKPVLCSNVTSLPEVAGDAAVYFDPTEPRQIAAAIDALQDASRIADHVRRGHARAAALGNGRAMAERYLSIFWELIQPRG